MKEVCKHCGRVRPGYIADPTCPASTETTAFVYCDWRQLEPYTDTHDGDTEPNITPSWQL